jgi:hypothetical protein
MTVENKTKGGVNDHLRIALEDCPKKEKNYVGEKHTKNHQHKIITRIRLQQEKQFRLRSGA